MKDKIEKNSLKVVVLALGMFGSAGLYAASFHCPDPAWGGWEEKMDFDSLDAAWKGWDDEAGFEKKRARLRHMPAQFRYSFLCRPKTVGLMAEFFHLLPEEDRMAALGHLDYGDIVKNFQYIPAYNQKEIWYTLLPKDQSKTFQYLKPNDRSLAWKALAPADKVENFKYLPDYARGRYWEDLSDEGKEKNNEYFVSAEPIENE